MLDVTHAMPYVVIIGGEQLMPDNMHTDTNAKQASASGKTAARQERPRKGVVISARNGRKGVRVPKNWANDVNHDQVYWLNCDGCNGAVIVDYYDHGETDLESDTPFGDSKYLADMLRAGITADGMADAGLIFAGTGRTRYSQAQYAATIFRVSAPQSADGRMYVAQMLLAYPEVMEVGEISASVIATTEDAKRRERDVMGRFGDAQAIKEGDRILYRQRDPYLRQFEKGEPMYAFELTEYDKAYPHHPLTQLRRLIAGIIMDN
jgi:hypothetical protein